MFQNKKTPVVSTPGNTAPATPDASQREKSVETVDGGTSVRERIHSHFKKLLRQDRDPNDPFNKVLGVLDEVEKKDEMLKEEELKRLYEVWATTFNTLKQEFTDALGLFYDIEDLVQGWHVVSPNLGEWRPIGISPNGYTFAAGVMKNHSRNAPYPEKSVTVTFGINDYKPGIGDETWLGRQTPISDFLTGLEDCRGKTISEQYEASKRLYKTLQEFKLTIRLNHKDVGQQVAEIELSALEQHSLRSICQGLFVNLNNDILLDLNPKALPHSERPLLEDLS